MHEKQSKRNPLILDTTQNQSYLYKNTGIANYNIDQDIYTNI